MDFTVKFYGEHATLVDDIDVIQRIFNDNRYCNGLNTIPHLEMPLVVKTDYKKIIQDPESAQSLIGNGNASFHLFICIGRCSGVVISE